VKTAAVVDELPKDHTEIQTQEELEIDESKDNEVVPKKAAPVAKPSKNSSVFEQKKKAKLHL